MESLVEIQKAFSGKKVLISGHTGFKGSWLCEWLLSLGASVSGISLPPNTSPSLFELLNLERRVDHHIVDVRNREALAATVQKIEPEVVFHLAAQPIVREGYLTPVETWNTNVLGTVNLLDSIRRCDSAKACIVVTTDKCYEVAEGNPAYRETDKLGGHDPYSSSKAAAEIAVSSFRRSYFSAAGDCQIATARAGNVIGGGDWAKDRIIVDIARSLSSDKVIELRNPSFTRPWQHVLDPLSGYLLLARNLLSPQGREFADAWNFGPHPEAAVSVEELTRIAISAWGGGRYSKPPQSGQPHETEDLKLSCAKAQERLLWKPTWDLQEATQQTMDWYQHWHLGKNVLELTQKQIHSFQKDMQSKRATP